MADLLHVLLLGGVCGATGGICLGWIGARMASGEVVVSRKAAEGEKSNQPSEGDPTVAVSAMSASCGDE